MAIELTTKYQPYTDELFTTESKKAEITNNDFEWTGAHTVKVYKVTTADMNDYDRDGSGDNASRYGAVQALSATTEEFTLRKDRSFTFATDRLDIDETADQLASAAALARQQREVIIPEVDAYTIGIMCAGAGTKPDAETITAANIYDLIIAGTEVLDDNEVPDTGRFILVSPDVYRIMKKNTEITLDTDIGQDQRKNGVIAMVDGMDVIKVPSARLPEGFGFLIGHKVATVAPTKLESYKIHQDPPGINGDLVEGRIVYDAFVLANKTKALYYQAAATE